MKKGNCIFHVPNYIDKRGRTGSQVRPIKMLRAFEEQGYHVDVVMGYGRDRKRQISRIKKSIRRGKKYEFLYSESSTMPTLLTEKNHLPMYPFLDFGFLMFCRRHGIRIGLFYRDIYWKFPLYKENVHGLKYYAAQLCYRYDLIRYEQLLSKFYLPTSRMEQHINKRNLRRILDELPPGAERNLERIARKHDYYIGKGRTENISIFYVGCILSHYVFTKLLEAVNELDYVELTLCCRREEWEIQKKEWRGFLNGRVHVIHECGDGLEKYYEKADLCVAWFDEDEYRKFAMPVKLFEYLGRTIPVIASKGTAAGDFVESRKIGWAIPYDKEQLKNLLEELHKDWNLIIEKHENCRKALEENTWYARAGKVAEDLTSLSK